MDDTRYASGRRRREPGITVWTEEGDPGQGLVRAGERSPGTMKNGSGPFLFGCLMTCVVGIDEDELV